MRSPLAMLLCRSFCTCSRPTVPPESQAERKEKKKQLRASDVVRNGGSQNCPVAPVMKRKNVTRTSDLSLNGQKGHPRFPSVWRYSCKVPVSFLSIDKPACLKRLLQTTSPRLFLLFLRRPLRTCSTSPSSSRAERPKFPSTRSVLTVFMVPQLPHPRRLSLAFSSFSPRFCLSFYGLETFADAFCEGSLRALPVLVDKLDVEFRSFPRRWVVFE